MSKTLFLALDAYSHHPRNFWGFKKKGAKPEQRPVTCAMRDSEGILDIRGNFRSARLKDDPKWSTWVVNYYQYGGKRSNADILMDIAEAIDNEQVSEVVIYDMDYDALRNVCKNNWMNAISADQHKIVMYSDWLEEKLDDIPDEVMERLSHAGLCELHINKEEGEEYTIEQKMEIFYSHKQCPSIDKWDMSLGRAHKMYLIGVLADMIKHLGAANKGALEML